MTQRYVGVEDDLGEGAASAEDLRLREAGLNHVHGRAADGQDTGDEHDVHVGPVVVVIVRHGHGLLDRSFHFANVFDDVKWFGQSYRKKCL